MYPWLIHVDVWQKPTTLKAIIFQLKSKKKKKVEAAKENNDWLLKSFKELPLGF